MSADRITSKRRLLQQRVTPVSPPTTDMLSGESLKSVLEIAHPSGLLQEDKVAKNLVGRCVESYFPCFKDNMYTAPLHTSHH